MKTTKLFIPSPGKGSNTAGGGGASDVNYTRSEGITANLGGLTSGYVPNGSVQDLLDDLLYPYLQPAFTSFQLNGFANPLEIGQEIPSGLRQFSWGIANSGNLQLNSVIIRDLSYGLDLATGLSNDGVAMIELPSAISRDTPGQTQSWGILGESTQGDEFGRQYQHTWRARFLAGTIPAANISAFLSEASSSGVVLPLSGHGIALRRNDLSASRVNTDSYNCVGNKHIFFLWDTALGTSTAANPFTSGGFGAPFNSNSVTVTNAFGVVRTYLLFTSVNAFNGAAVPITVN